MTANLILKGAEKMATIRRTWLKHVSLGTGALLLRPVLDRLHAGEVAKRKKPWRVVFVMQANGFHPWAAQPKNLPITEAGPAKTVNLSLDDYELSEDMEPLKDYKKLVTIIQRLSGANVRPSHSARFGALSGVLGRTAKAQTIDAALARLSPGTFPMVNLGVATSELRSENGMVRVCSAWGPDKPIGTQLDPNLAYKALFGEAAGKIDEGGRLMDLIGDDVSRVQKNLSAAERERFAQYLDVFETLDQRQDLFRKAEEAGVKGAAPKVGDAFASTLAAKRLTAQFELAAASLICGLTSVATIASGACDTNGYFGGLGVDDQELHQVGHFKAEGRTWQAVYTTIRRFHFKLIAGLIDRLNQVSDEDGTPLMENTLIVYTSDGADTHHSSGKQWPFVLIGNLRSALRTGRFLEYPEFGQPGNRPINALYATLLYAVGQPSASFNATEAGAKPEESGTLEELLS